MKYNDDEVQYLIKWFMTPLTQNRCDVESVPDQWRALKFEVVSNPQMKHRSFNSVWELMLTKKTFESVQRCPSSFEDILCYSGVRSRE